MKFSPGPWFNRQDRDFYTLTEIVDPEGDIVIDEGFKSDERSQANARLISAAPELYDCALGLRVFLKMLDNAGFEALKNEPSFFKFMGHVRKAKELADKAIAKVEGTNEI